MTQYWIEVPVENAKEVVQRRINELSNNGGVIVSYDQNCEVVLYQNEWNNWSDDRTAVWFGTFFVTNDGTSTTEIKIEGNAPINSTLTTMNWSNYPPDSGEYPCIMFNSLNDAGSLGTVYYFVGYKFNLIYP